MERKQKAFLVAVRYAGDITAYRVEKLVNCLLLTDGQRDYYLGDRILPKKLQAVITDCANVDFTIKLEV